MPDTTNLAYIDKAFNDVLERQVNAAPKAVREAATAKSVTNVAGFAVLDPQEADRQITEHIGRMKSYSLDRAALIAKLAEQNIPVLATLPVKLWKQVCDASGLIQVHPGEKGRVGVKGIKEFEKRMSSLISVVVGNGVFATMFIALNALLYHLIPPVGFADFGINGMMAGLVTGAVGTFLYGVGAFSAIENRLFCFIIRRAGDRKLLDKALTLDASAYSPSTTLTLPTPPVEIQSVILAAAKKHVLHVAAVAEAMAFTPALTELVIGERSERLVKEAEAAARARAEAWEAWARDPIVYIIQNDVVAIIAQFGDFPVEKSVVDNLVANEVVEEAY